MVLITALQLSVVTLMIVGAALALGPASLTAGQTTLYQGEAQRACESGAAYAFSQLRQNPIWRGDKNAVTVNTSDLFVEEDRGNVVGLVRTPSGHWSQFRFRFNFQDGAAGGDDLDDPVSLPLDFTCVSINNLQGFSPAPAPRALSVNSASPIHHSVPVWAVSLAVEGRSGSPCARLSPANPNVNVPGATRRVVEMVCQVPDMGPSVQESGSMSGGDFQINLREASGLKVRVTSKDLARTPRLRTKAKATISGGDGTQNYDSNGGEVKSKTSSLDAHYDPTQTQTGPETPADPFYQLAWNDVKKAETMGPQVAAGTYVWWEDGSLHYYDLPYDQYVSFITANPTDQGLTPAPLPDEIAADGDSKSLTLKASVYVKPTNAGNELNVIPRKGAPELPPGDPDNLTNPYMQTGPAALAANPALLYQFLTNYQSAQGGEIDFEDSGGNGPELNWTPGDPTSVNFSPDGTNYTLEDLLTVAWGGRMPAGFNWDNGGDQAPLAFDYKLAANDLGIREGSVNGQIAIDVEDGLSAADLKVSFKKTGGGQAVLTSEGNVRLTGTIDGTGGSITSGGNISITGLGANFGAGDTPAEAINLYAKGDIRFSSLDEPTPGNFQFQNVKLKGVVYCQGDFVARLGSTALTGPWGRFDLDGLLIAYGGDPSDLTVIPGANGKGKVDLRTEGAEFVFDPVYLGALSSKLPLNFRLKTLSWNNNL